MESQKEDCRDQRYREDRKVSKGEKTQDILSVVLEQKQKKTKLREKVAIIYKPMPSKLPITDKSKIYKKMKIFSEFPKFKAAS